MAEAVVVTGIGIVSPLGDTLEKFTEALLCGYSGAGQIQSFDASDLPTTIGAEVKNFCSPIAISDRKVSFGMMASTSAVRDAQKESQSLKEFYCDKPSQLSFGIGLELFSMPDLVDYLKAERSGTLAHKVYDLTYLQTPSDIVLPLISREHHLIEAPLAHVSACAASTDAIGMAFELIRSGRCSWMIAGGTDSMINPLGVGGFCKLMALTRRNGDPSRASRPFDRDRDGFLIGEGAAALILESRTGALARGAQIYGEIVGYGNSFDAHGISEPHPEGEGAVLAMSRALSSAGIKPDDICHVNAHGTSTPKNDVVETRALKRLFGEHVGKISVSSTKSMLGHLISASGAVEIAALLTCASKGFFHPTINLAQPDTECDLDYINDGKRALRDGYYLKNSFAFGGQNASLVLKVGR